MLRTIIPTIGLATTRLGFGTSRLHYLASSAERQALLALAYDLGVRHFDTAPAYGEGLAERELGAFARTRPDVFVTTKHGIPVDPMIAGLPGPLVRPAIAARVLRRRALGLSRPPLPPITGETLRRDVERSLRRLGVERIDLHLLHDPTPERLVDLDGVRRTYDDLIAAGKIRSAGVCGPFEVTLEMVRLLGGTLVVQAAEWEWTDARVPDIVCGAISRQHQSRRQSVVTDPEARLDTALRRRPQGVVLFCSTKAQHVRDIVRHADARMAA